MNYQKHYRNCGVVASSIDETCSSTSNQPGSLGRPGGAAALAAGHRGLVTWRSSILGDLAHLAVPAVTHEKVCAAYRHANTFLCACLTVRQTSSRLNICMELRMLCMHVMMQIQQTYGDMYETVCAYHLFTCTSVLIKFEG